MYKNFRKCLISLIFSLLINYSLCSNSKENSDDSNTILDNLSWDCANNASCVKTVATNIIKNYQHGEQINFGLFSVEKLSSTFSDNNKDTTGRSISSFMEFIKGNAIRIPLGPMVFRVQRSEDDADYMEVALLKKVPDNDQGRRVRDRLQLQGQGQGQGQLGNNNRRHGQKEKKNMQMLIPMYLAANTFGWTLLAVKAVGVLTLKALIVSKVAFLVAAAVIIKKLMDSASEKMMLQHPQPFMMPYSMDYGGLHGHAMPNAEEFYNLHLTHPHAAAALENMAAAESNNLAHTVEIQANATQPQIMAAIAAANAAAANGAKIKRNDQWTGVKSSRPSSLYSYLPNGSQQPVYVYQK